MLSTDLGEINTYSQEAVDEYLKGAELKRNSGVRMLVNTATDQGATATWLDRRTAIINQDGKRILSHLFIGAESAVAADLYADKVFTKLRWQAAGVKTPYGKVVRSADEAYAFRQELGRSIVIKPKSSYGSKGVSVDLDTQEEIEQGFEEAKAQAPVVLVEEYIHIETEYRCFVGDGELYALVERLPAHVVGDGESSIQQLIAQKNLKRKLIPSTRTYPIVANKKVEKYLAQRGYALSTVLDKGQVQQLSHPRVMDGGGDLKGILDVVSDEVKQLAIDAARAIPGAHWAGLDLIESDDGQIYAIEINANSQYNGIQYPSYGTPVPIAEILYKERLKQAGPEDLDAPVKLPSLHSKDGAQKLNLPDHRLRSHGVPLHKLFHTWLEGQGYSVEVKAPPKAVLAIRAGEQHWFSGCLTSADQGAPVKAASRHGVVRSALRAAKIARVPGTHVAAADLDEFLDKQIGPVSVTASFAHWRGENSAYWGLKGAPPIRRATPSELKRGYFVQSYLPGQRFRVLSSPDTCFAVLHRGSDAAITADELATVAELAADSIRALPGLRWAAVDVIIPDTGLKVLSPRVEGLSPTPRVMDDHRVVAGDLASFFSYLSDQ